MVKRSQVKILQGVRYTDIYVDATLVPQSEGVRYFYMKLRKCYILTSDRKSLKLNEAKVVKYVWKRITQFIKGKYLPASWGAGISHTRLTWFKPCSLHFIDPPCGQSNPIQIIQNKIG